MGSFTGNRYGLYDMGGNVWEWCEDWYDNERKYRVVHHALCNLMPPVLERRFIARSFSCQIGKGTTAARECCRQLTNRCRLALECDVANFFADIGHAIPLGKRVRHLACSAERRS